MVALFSEPHNSDECVLQPMHVLAMPTLLWQVSQEWHVLLHLSGGRLPQLHFHDLHKSLFIELLCRLNA